MLQITVIGVAGLLVVGGVLWFGSGSTQPASPVGAFETSSTTARILAVHVAGLVQNPGLVEVEEGARVADVIRVAGGATSAADLAALNLAAPVRDGDHVVVPAIGASLGSGIAVAGIDINRATATELEELPGVGPVLAKRIAEHRAAHGPFETVEDLLDVPGIGEAKLDAMRDAIRPP